MTPEYLEQLADIADPDKLWRLCPFDQLALDPVQRGRLDTGVALRRHASDVRELRELIGTGKSRLITPYSPNGRHVATVATPAKIARFVRDVS